jgi:hypothetical protein
MSHRLSLLIKSSLNILLIEACDGFLNLQKESYTPEEDAYQWLKLDENGYLALACGDPPRILMVPVGEIVEWWPHLSQTDRVTGQRNVRVIRVAQRWELRMPQHPPVELSAHLVI